MIPMKISAAAGDGIRPSVIAREIAKNDYLGEGSTVKVAWTWNQDKDEWIKGFVIRSYRPPDKDMMRRLKVETILSHSVEYIDVEAIKGMIARAMEDMELATEEQEEHKEEEEQEIFDLEAPVQEEQEEQEEEEEQEVFDLEAPVPEEQEEQEEEEEQEVFDLEAPVSEEATSAMPSWLLQAKEDGVYVEKPKVKIVPSGPPPSFGP
ncbi:uncharacterized protein N7484_000468 [Penicillium longicatenatum]|uniref:uncharacterized protein n=1 Tax=Penicillium longicatenatum TaxID=1561947 RepID=UPI002548BA45|nr:uncharacterized protein N7484_000468 [Penicillium longicatenatum]KAJ5661096.1 hypothetical protein N7484_000468 [Penicillium longicatenatum]